jgi:hypothetical protein
MERHPRRWTAAGKIHLLLHPHTALPADRQDFAGTGKILPPLANMRRPTPAQAGP